MIEKSCKRLKKRKLGVALAKSVAFGGVGCGGVSSRPTTASCRR